MTSLQSLPVGGAGLNRMDAHGSLDLAAQRGVSRFRIAYVIGTQHTGSHSRTNTGIGGGMAVELAAGMTPRRHATPFGNVWMVSKTEFPSNLLIHGFMRGPPAVARWSHLIPDLGIVVLPNHSGAGPVAERSPRGYADALRHLVESFPKAPFIIAESLGAVIGFTLPSRAMVAVEPPLSVDNLWPLHRTVARAKARGIEIGNDVEAMFSEPFHWALERVASPTLVIAGNVPLLPPRDVWPEPSLITDEDAAVFAANPHIEVRRIPGGHALLDTNPEAVWRAIQEFAARFEDVDLGA